VDRRLADGPGRRLFFLGEGLFVFRLMLLYTVMSLTVRLAMSSLHRVSDRLQGDDSEIPIGRLLFGYKNHGQNSDLIFSSFAEALLAGRHRSHRRKAPCPIA
jgi:hypothetical protein